MKRKCRIWLPKQLASTDDLTHSLLFGWFRCHSSSCLDVIVAFISDESSLSNGGSKLQVITPLQIFLSLILFHEFVPTLFSSISINSVCNIFPLGFLTGRTP